LTPNIIPLAAHRDQQSVSGEQVLRALDRELRPEHGNRDLMLYLHIPFCTSKCTFCAWVSGIDTPQLRSAADVRSHYVDAVIDQIRFYAPGINALGYVAPLVYWGGGTPSILEPEEITRLGNALRESFDLSGVREYSVESSPETLTRAKLEAFRSIGVNRVSIGVQSFEEQELRRAGRAHSAPQAEEAVRLARSEHVSNINIDLIVGFPRQTPEGLARTIDTAVALAPEHVTAYDYRQAPGTSMARQISSGHLPRSSMQAKAGAADQVHQALAAAGYVEYMPMYYSLGDRNRFEGEQYYFEWRGDYLGFGSGSRSILSHHLLQNNRGALDSFLAAPTAFDHCLPLSFVHAAKEGSTLLLRGNQLEYERFYARYGFDFSRVWEHESFRELRAELAANGTPLVASATGVHIAVQASGLLGGDRIRQLASIRSRIARRRG